MSFDNNRRSGKPSGRPAGKFSGKPAGKFGGRPNSNPKFQNDRSFSRKPDRSFQQPRRDSDDDFKMRLDEDENTAFIAGRNAVIEALKANPSADTVFIEKGQSGGSLTKIIALAKQAGCPIKEVSSQKLDGMANGTPHQGVVLSVSAVEYAEVQDILAKAEEKGEKPFIVIADDIEDPHNLGALIRTAETAGAHGIIIPKRRGVGLTSAVFKTSAGAASHLPVARVSNLASTVDSLKEQGIWVYGCDMQGQHWCQTDFSGGVALIVGSEGKGMSRLLKEKCDQMVSLPMCGQITSLNASVAGGIIMYEVTRQRLGISANQPQK